jgi:hypothetical protein
MINGKFQEIDGLKVMGGCADRGFLGDFDRTPNAGKFPWVDRRMGDRFSGGIAFGNGVHEVSRQENRVLPQIDDAIYLSPF